MLIFRAWATCGTTVWNWTACLKFSGSTKVPLSWYRLRCSVIPNSCTPWRHVVDHLFVFCGILASFLDWISLSVTVVIPRPESSLSVNVQLGRKMLGAKIEIVNCLLVFCTRKWRFHLFSESSCCTATEVALVWVINGSTSGSESLDTARLFRLFLTFTALGQRTQIT